MAERWVLVEDVPPEVGGIVELPPDEAHHLSQVLRRQDRETVTLFDGKGRVASAVLRHVGHGRARAEVYAVRAVPPPEAGTVPSVALGILHGQAMDWAVQKAVELGVPRFIPVVCDRSQVAAPVARRRMTHWERVARQSLKQCHRPWAMELSAPCTLDALLDEVPPSRGILADREGGCPGPAGTGESLVLLVGPEGGLAVGERRAVLQAGWRAIRLGGHILRAETAVVAGTVLLSAVRQG